VARSYPFSQLCKDFVARPGHLGWWRKALATDAFKKALLLDPSNREAADKLKEVSGSEKNSDG
jgi:hypothetical protein